MNISGSVDMPKEVAGAVVKVTEQYAGALNAGDFVRWMSVWAENGIQYFPDAPPRYGKEQIAAGMEPAFVTFDFRGFTINLKDVRVFGEQAYAHGTYGYSMTPKEGGDTTKISGKFLSIFEKQTDGSWKMLIDCFNYNGAPELV